MSRDGSVTFEWAGAERRFRLAIGELRDLQEHPYVDAGPGWVLSRLDIGTWRVDDIIETIRLGLIGGGAIRSEAGALVARRIIHFREHLQPAIKILLAALSGTPDEAPKKSTTSASGDLEQLPRGKWRFAIFYGDGAVMGLGADAIDRMSLWQFLAAQGGYERSNGGASDTGLSDDEFRELSELVDQ